MAITLSNSALATRLAGHARDLAHGMGRFRLPFATRPATASEPLPLAEGLPDLPQLPLSPLAVLDLPLLPLAPEAQAKERLSRDYAALARGGDWSQFSEALITADRGRKVAPGGSRLAALIAEAARADVLAEIAQGNLRAAAAQLSRLEDRAGPAETDPAAALVLAQAHLDLAEAHDRQAGGAGAFRDLVARAEALLEPFDPIEEDMPQLAAARYRLLRGLNEAEQLFRDWYEDWSDLDPRDPAPHAAQAEHLLPQWFGDLAGFEAEARAALRRSRSTTGAAAYAVFHLTGARQMGALLPGLDMALFLTGLGDHARQLGGRRGDQLGGQFGANLLAGLLADLAQTHEAELGARAPLHRALIGHLRDGGLREIHLGAFSGGEAQVSWALELAFGAELAQGARLMAGPAGILPLYPAAA